MKITIFGAGSIGSLFAGKLAQQGHDIRVIARKRHIEAINENGLTVLEGTGFAVVNLKAQPNVTSSSLNTDLLVITTKAYDNKVVSSQLSKKLPANVPILILQNGMGNEEVFINNFPQNPLYRAITTEAAEVTLPGIVKHVASGRTCLGHIEHGNDSFAKDIVRLFLEAGLKAKKVPDIQLAMWNKLLVNISINPLGALLGVPNGEILDHWPFKIIFDAIINEGVQVAKTSLPQYDFSDARDNALTVIQKTKNNKCSMLQDLERGRKTEIDYLNGYIVKEGTNFNLSTPINAAIVEIIKSLERENYNHERTSTLGHKDLLVQYLSRKAIMESS